MRMASWAHKVSKQGMREKAKSYFIRLAQMEAFKDELEVLRGGKQLPESSQLFKLSPFVDGEGLLRTRSRLNHLDFVEFEQANPILLHASKPMGRQIVENAHQQYQHTVGLNCMLGVLFKQFHILGLTKVIKGIMKNCLVCRKRAAKPVQTLMAPLKKSILEKRPFSETGIDYAGPFSIKIGRGKTRKQMFVLVLTCLNTRCVHFEVCEDQKTSSVLSALTRFANLRGLPRIIKSDNQTSFVAARKELVDFMNMLDHDKIQEKLSREFDQGIEWDFIPPRAPHFGGSWEIMVKAMKRAVETITQGQDVTEDQFRTIISKAAALLNSRPLSRSLLEEKEVVITPNSFLVGNYETDLRIPNQSLKNARLGAKYQEVLKMEQEVWKHFIQEILPEISPRTKWYKTFPELKPGDVVLVIEEGTPKGSWKLAVVKETKKSQDQVVRSASVIMNGKVFDRPIVHLFPLFDSVL